MLWHVKKCRGKAVRHLRHVILGYFRHNSLIKRELQTKIYGMSNGQNIIYINILASGILS